MPRFAQTSDLVSWSGHRGLVELAELPANQGLLAC